MTTWQPVKGVGIGCGLAIALSLSALPLSALAQPPTSAAADSLSPPATEAATESSITQTVTLTLPEVIQLVVQSNRDLKNAGLDRIVQRQELKEAESSFDPRFTPTLTLGIIRTLSSSPTPPIGFVPSISSSTTSQSATSFLGSGSGRNDPLGDRATFNSSAQLQAQLNTRIGTRFSLNSDPLSAFPLSLTISQPLLRGFGKTVNEAPVKVARLTDTKNSLALRQTLIDKITEAISAYRTLYERQESVRIQEAALTNKRYQLEVTTVLVKAGRKARANLVDIAQSIADGERQLIDAKNQLALANSVLLRLIDTPKTFIILVAADSMEGLIQAAIARARSLDSTTLLTTAYLKRPSYLQAKLDIDVEKLNLIGAQDEKRWGLNLQSNTSLGTSSQTSASVVLSREFGNQRLETEVQRRQIGIQKNSNRLNQLTEIIKTELSDQLNTISSTQRQVVAAQQASELAQRQLAIAQERFKRGKIDIFEVTQKEDTLTTARNTELSVRLDFWISMVQLDRILGTTLDTWSAFIQPDQWRDN
jgi:outer membrane protein TolC